MLDRKTIRFWVIIALAMTCMLAAGVALGGGRELPLSQCCDLYRRYADHPGIQATFVKNFFVNDSVPVDVTILTATTDSTWAVLRRDFSLRDEVVELQEKSNQRSVSTFFAPKHDHSAPMDTTGIRNNDLIAMCAKDRTVMVFDIKNRNQITAIMLYKIRELDI